MITELVGNIPTELIKTAENLIDPTSMKVITNYLNDKNSGIDYVIRVIEKDELPFVSAFLSDKNTLSQEQFNNRFSKLIQSGKIKILTKTDFKTIPENAYCLCIHQQPVYVISVDETKVYS